MTIKIPNLRYKYAVNLLEKYRDLERETSISRSNVGYDVVIDQGVKE